MSRREPRGGMTSFTDQGSVDRRRPSVAWSDVRGARWLPLLTVFAAAIGLRLVVVANTDVSWLITLSEKVLDGQRLYADLVELNPPASIILYLPLVALARVLALRPEVAAPGEMPDRRRLGDAGQPCPSIT